MKALLLILLTSTTLFAAPPVIVIESLTTVTIDGVPSGTVVDALANKPSARLAMLDALIAREAGLVVAKASIEADSAKKLAVIESAKAALESGDAKAKITALAAIEDARKPEKEKQKAVLDEQIAKLKRELDTLNKSDKPPVVVKPKSK